MWSEVRLKLALGCPNEWKSMQCPCKDSCTNRMKEKKNKVLENYKKSTVKHLESYKMTVSSDKREYCASMDLFHLLCEGLLSDHLSFCATL